MERILKTSIDDPFCLCLIAISTDAKDPSATLPAATDFIKPHLVAYRLTHLYRLTIACNSRSTRTVLPAAPWCAFEVMVKTVKVFDPSVYTEEALHTTLSVNPVSAPPNVSVVLPQLATPGVRAWYRPNSMPARAA
jgi:hypothetical protein